MAGSQTFHLQRVQFAAILVLSSFTCTDRALAQDLSSLLSPSGIPVQSVAPEVVLAECLTHGIAVTESRITYGLESPSPGPVPMAPARLHTQS